MIFDSADTGCAHTHLLVRAHTHKIIKSMVQIQPDPLNVSHTHTRKFPLLTLGEESPKTPLYPTDCSLTLAKPKKQMLKKEETD